MYYPVFLNIKGKKCVVIGGGEVAARKAKSLLDAGAEVTVISPRIVSPLKALAEGSSQIQFIRRQYVTDDLDGTVLVIACTSDRTVNLKVASDARNTSIRVNVADDAANSDFIMPSYFSIGDLTVAVSTSGKSPALAKKIRTSIEEEFGPEYAKLVSIVADVRQTLMKKKIHIKADEWQSALELKKSIDLIKNGREQDLRQKLIDTLAAGGKHAI